MNDQAQVLRGLARNRADWSKPAPAALPPRACTVAITSGKGGVGKSSVAVNLAVALAQMGLAVSLLDANLGLGNIDLLCGLNGYWNLSHVLSGARTLQDITLVGPAGVHVVPGASGLEAVANASPAAQRDVLAQLRQLETNYDYLIVDTATGVHRTVRQFVSAADRVIVVATPEPTAIADAYATIKTISGVADARVPELLLNQVDSPAAARDILLRVQRTARSFLHTHVESAGAIPRDIQMAHAVFRRSPLLMTHPESPAARAIELCARRLFQQRKHMPTAGSYFDQFQDRSRVGAA